MMLDDTVPQNAVVEGAALDDTPRPGPALDRPLRSPHPEEAVLDRPSRRIRLRFVCGRDAVSLAIRARENFPFSHAEAVTPQGRYLGAHADGGVAARAPGYDAAWLERELFVELAETAPGQAEAFYAFLERHIGEPYDFESILGFLLPGVALHEAQHVICSAFVTLGLRQCGWFAAPLCEPAHKISPRDLLLMISARIPVEM